MCKLIRGGLRGFDFAESDVYVSPYAARDGGIATRRRFAIRVLTLKFEITASGEEADRVRRKIVSMMDPRRDLTVHVKIGGAARWITAIPYGRCELSRETLFSNAAVTLNLIAPDVFFSAEEAKRVRFHEIAPLLTFPMNFTSGAGTEAGYYRVCKTAKISNCGDAECGVSVRIRASGGSVVRPGIELDGKFIRADVTLSDGDEIVFETGGVDAKVLVCGREVFTFDRDSVFFSLPVGESALSLTADSGAEFMDAEAQFCELYFGA